MGFVDNNQKNKIFAFTFMAGDFNKKFAFQPYRQASNKQASQPINIYLKIWNFKLIFMEDKFLN